MRRRGRFLVDAAFSGWRWLWGVSGRAQRLFGLAVVLGGVSTGSGLLSNRPAWALLAGAATLLLIMFVEGAYQLWRDAEDGRAMATDEGRVRARRREVATRLNYRLRLGNIVRKSLADPHDWDNWIERAGDWSTRAEGAIREAIGDVAAARFASDVGIPHDDTYTRETFVKRHDKRLAALQEMIAEVRRGEWDDEVLHS